MLFVIYLDVQYDTHPKQTFSVHILNLVEVQLETNCSDQQSSNTNTGKMGAICNTQQSQQPRLVQSSSSPFGIAHNNKRNIQQNIDYQDYMKALQSSIMSTVTYIDFFNIDTCNLIISLIYPTC